jgi:hypothetical protein
MSLRVGIDVDGVLADFRAAFRATAHEAGDMPDAARAGDSPSLSDGAVRRAWKEIGGHTNWWVRLQPYEPDQVRRLYSLARRWKWEVFFLTKRPGTAGDSVQFQTQWWLEQHGYYLPSVLTVLGSRGEVANALQLDIAIDDLALNCVEVISASTSKALLMLRDQRAAAERQRALSRGIGVVATLEEALNVLERLQDVIPGRRGRLLRLMDWFPGAQKDEPLLPYDPRTGRPIPDE